MKLSKQAYDKIKQGVISELLMDGEIKLDEVSLRRLSEHIAPLIPKPSVQASRAADLMSIVESLPKPRDGVDGRHGRDGQDLLFTEAIKQSVISTVADMVDLEAVAEKASKLIDPPDPAQIAKVAASLVKLPEVRADLEDSQIEQILNSEAMALRFMTRAVFNRKIQELDAAIKSNRPVNAGISGSDMIEEINKILGDDWQGIQEVTVIPKVAGSYQLALSDRFKIIEAYTMNPVYYTFPRNSVEDIPIGSWGEMRRVAVSTFELIKGTGVTFRSELGDVDLKLSGADGFSAFWEKTDTDVFLISGAVEAA